MQKVRKLGALLLALVLALLTAAPAGMAGMAAQNAGFAPEPAAFGEDGAVLRLASDSEEEEDEEEEDEDEEDNEEEDEDNDGEICVVSFETNCDAEFDDQEIPMGGKIRNPGNPNRGRGWTFAGWYEDEDFDGSPWNFTRDTVEDDDEFTLYAKWLCAVKFNSNGGSNVPSKNVPEDEKVRKPSNPTKKGWVFAGWYDGKNFKNAWNFSKDTVDEPMTLYARWAQVSAKKGKIAVGRTLTLKGKSNAAVKSVKWSVNKKKLAALKPKGKGNVNCVIAGKGKGTVKVTAKITFKYGKTTQKVTKTIKIT